MIFDAVMIKITLDRFCVISGGKLGFAIEKAHDHGVLFRSIRRRFAVNVSVY